MSTAPFDDSLSLPDGDGSTAKSSAPSTATATASKQIMLGKFRLLSLLGKGSMGKVLRAEDTKLKRHVALKCLRKDQSAATYRTEQFIREARSAATLEHPSIVQIYEVGEASLYLYIAMELIEGGSLGSLVKACGPFDLTRACQLTAEAAEALDYAAQLGVTHRDIKPENLMLTRSGRCKITDFGLARIDDPADGFAMPAGAVGTPNYMAPETIQGLPASNKSDVYSLACVLFFLLTGRAPFHSKDRTQILQMQIQTPPPDICTIRPDLPQSVSKILLRALSKNPDDRPTAGTFAKQLRAHTIPVNSSGSQILPNSATVFLSNQVPQKKLRTLLYTAGALATLLIAATVTIFVMNSNKPQPASAAVVVQQEPAAVAPKPAPEPVAVAPVMVAPVVPTPVPVAVIPPTPVAVTPVVEKPAVAPLANSSTVRVTDATAILAAIKANEKITILAVPTAVQFDSAEKIATVSFSANPNFQVTYSGRLYTAMTKKFGGKSGNGIINKPLLFTGYPTLTNKTPQLLITSTSQIELP